VVSATLEMVNRRYGSPGIPPARAAMKSAHRLQARFRFKVDEGLDQRTLAGAQGGSGSRTSSPVVADEGMNAVKAPAESPRGTLVGIRAELPKKKKKKPATTSCNDHPKKKKKKKKKKQSAGDPSRGQSSARTARSSKDSKQAAPQ